jgi:hypothetical protein
VAVGVLVPEEEEEEEEEGKEVVVAFLTTPLPVARLPAMAHPPVPRRHERPEDTGSRCLWRSCEGRRRWSARPVSTAMDVRGRDRAA